MSWERVLSLTFEFLITIIILIGGGMLLYLFRSDSENFKAILAIVSALFSSIITFWFQRRSTERVLDIKDRGYRIDGTKKDPGGGLNG